MRSLLLAATAAAVLAAAALLKSAPTSGASAPASREPGLPDRVLAATYIAKTPGEPPCNLSCDYNRLSATVVVHPGAFLVVTAGQTLAIRRGGREWQELGELLRSLDLDDGDVLVALEDGATYEDLLVTLDFTRSAGFSPRVRPPA